jgi:hypothetical protein
VSTPSSESETLVSASLHDFEALKIIMYTLSAVGNTHRSAEVCDADKTEHHVTPLKRNIT